MNDPFSHLNHWAQTQVDVWLFYGLAVTAIVLAYGVLLDRRTIRCGFLLIGVFGSIAGIFLMMNAQFLAMAQVMIYAVGITLVVVIALMLTNPRMEEEESTGIPVQKVPALVAAVMTFATIYLALRSEAWPHEVQPTPPDNVLQIGKLLLTYYALPFEFASILLLVALIGAIMLARSEKNAPGKAELALDAAEDIASEEDDNAVQV